MTGRVAYCGPVAGVGPHYAALGHACPANYNPADHVMYILQTTGEADLLASFGDLLRRPQAVVEAMRPIGPSPAVGDPNPKLSKPW